MVSSRKRGRAQMEMESVEPVKEPPKEQSLLQRIRNMWEFANLVQFMFIFGRAVKIDEDLDVEDMEMECLKTHSAVLSEIGLALLKAVSSHRGLTPEIFDEYTRRQYVAKAPDRNPFGVEEEPAKFADFDVFTKIKVLQQLSVWSLGNPDRMREKMEEQKDTEQTIWRIEPFGWDSNDRTYFILDDNRLYRRTDAPPPPPPAPKPKKNSKKGKAARRASKRRKVSEPVESDIEPAEDIDAVDDTILEREDDGLGGMKWECIAVTFDEVNDFVSSLEKSRDPNEKYLRKAVVDDLLPLLEKQEESRKRKAAQKERELLNLEKLATAKRSSRIAGKIEQQKQDEEAREAERKKQQDLAMAKKEQERWMKLEKERESRMMTREQRLKEREARRILHEEELANLSEDNKKIEAGAAAGRLSERHIKAEIERKKQALEELAVEEDWIFDCICGAYGQIDDGTHSIACDKCNIWQHSKCVGVSQAEADREDFSFICTTCVRRAKDAERAKTQPPIKIRLNRPGSSSSPTVPKQNGSLGEAEPSPSDKQRTPQQAQQQSTPKPILPPSLSNGPQMAHFNVPQKPATLPQTTSRPVDQLGPSASPRKSPYSNNASMIQTPYNYSRPTNSGPLSSPGINGTTSQLSPPQPQPYPFINGNTSQPQKPQQPLGAPQSQTMSSYQNGSRIPAAQASTPRAANGHGIQAPAMNMNGQQQNSNNDIHRRNSISLPSPLSSTPVLTPRAPVNPNSGYLMSSSPPVHYTPMAPQAKYSPQLASSPRTQMAPLQQNQESGHASILPPSTTGYSPTKNSSPPRPTTSNGSLGIATPSALPPVTSLSPSPQLHNLTPPVKPSDPNQNRDYGQSVGS